jgi:hypothetical protein
MCRKLFLLTSSVLLLGLVSGASAALPAGWQSRDIGTIGGSAAEIDGIWAVSGNGEDIWYKSDQFHYAYTRLSGDGTIVARVVDNGTGSDSWAKGGVMIRETLNQNSKHAMMAITGGDGSGKAFQHRPATGEPAMSAHGGYQVSPPMWIKLTRAGNTFTGYYSVNGFNWIKQENWSLDGDDAAKNPATIEMARDVYIGLFATSHRSGEVRTYTFENVSVTGVPAPSSANIILVTEAIDWNMDGLRDDHSLESFLVSEGYSVDVRPDYWKLLTPDKIAELNATDLIIVSRLAWSDHYDEGNETTDWNSLTTPLLQMNAYFARNTRWKWVNSGAGTPDDTPLIYAQVVDPHHPIFWGVSLTTHDPADPTDSILPIVVQIIDPLVGTGLTSFIGTTDMGNGHLIAKPVQPSPNNWAWPVQLSMGWIAEWDAGVEFFEGAGQYSGGKRMLFCAGTQEIQYYDYDRQEVITTAQGELNLTAEGLQMFRNAIYYLLGLEITESEVESVVEDFETNDFSNFPWSSYGDESWETTRSERHSGYYSARSGSIEDGEETSLEVRLDCGSGYITFYCKVSCESGFDELTFYIDGLEQGKWSGQEDWAEVSFYVREGTRTFKWAYSKDSSISEGDDSAWIDDIVFPIGL